MTSPIQTALTIFGVLAILVFQQPAWAQTPTLADHPEFEVGDKWTFRYTNIGDRKDPITYTNQAFASQNGSGWIYGESFNPERKRKQLVQRYDYRRVDVKEVFEFEPTAPMFRGKRYCSTMAGEDRIQFPLVVGKEYEVEELWTDGEGVNKFHARVEAFEKLRLEAGEFETYRIALKGRWTRTGGAAFNGEKEATLWFAPAAKRVVKIVDQEKAVGGRPWSQGLTELIKWEPAAPLSSAIK